LPKEIAVPVTDELLANNAAYARYFTSGELPMPPAKKVAVLACMDARLNIYGALACTRVMRT
jgi:carbonic anhydrase